MYISQILKIIKGQYKEHKDPYALGQATRCFGEAVVKIWWIWKSPGRLIKPFGTVPPKLLIR